MPSIFGITEKDLAPILPRPYFVKFAQFSEIYLTSECSESEIETETNLVV